MKPLTELQPLLLSEPAALPDQMGNFPRFRYMGSKFRLLPWIHDTLQGLDFETATDAFSGSGVVSYLLKSMCKQVQTNDNLNFPSVLTDARRRAVAVVFRRQDPDLKYC
jgi:adenine-specific DNA-methyltransferase